MATTAPPIRLPQAGAESGIIPLRVSLDRIKSQMELERSSQITTWQDLANFMLPWSMRYLISNIGNGNRKDQFIINSTATLDLRTLSSGMMGGLTSPSRPWIGLETPYADLNQRGPVKAWLEGTTQDLHTIYAQSNLYTELPKMYMGLGCFGTHALAQLEDVADLVRFYSYPIGSYFLANNERLLPDQFARDFRMTVRQLVQKFGEENVSIQARSLYLAGNYERWIDVTQIIVPNEDHRPGSLYSKHKKWKQVYYERGARIDQILEETGFDEFPIHAVRWDKEDGDIYGHGPGHDVLADVMQLQMLERREMQAVEKQVNPPFVAPPSLQGVRISQLPGSITYATAADAAQLRPLHDFEFRLEGIQAKQAKIEKRISRAFFADLFLMLAQSEGPQMTAEEIRAREQEKLLMLGPVLESLNTDFLAPLVTRTINIMHRKKRLRPPPKELQGMPLRVQFTSVLAQAQKMVATGAIDRFFGFIGTLTGMGDQSALTKANTDAAIDAYGSALGVPTKLIRSDEEVAQIRAQQAKAAQAQQQAEMLAQKAQAAKNLSQTPMDGDTALTRMLNQNSAPGQDDEASGLNGNQAPPGIAP